jgi:hypothetical protein
MAKVSLTAGVDAKLAAKAVEQAEQAGIPLSTVVERALAQYLEQPQEPKRPGALWPRGHGDHRRSRLLEHSGV